MRWLLSLSLLFALAARAQDCSIDAYSAELARATQRATAKLAANESYRFSGLQLGWVSVPGDAWRRVDIWGRWFEPTRSNREAIAQFTGGRARSDCGVGRQVAQYATLAELFGADFDAAFAHDEIVIGTFNKLQRSNSVLLGRARGELFADGLAKRTTRFAGLPGFLYATHPDALSDTANQAQNFVVVDVSSDAAVRLREERGFAHYNERLISLWRDAQAIGDLGARGFERLLVTRHARSWDKLSRKQRLVARRMVETLDDAFFRGFVVYVHPKGIRPIGYHAVRMLDRNSGTPYRVELAMHNLYGEIYARWKHVRCDQVSSRSPVQ